MRQTLSQVDDIPAQSRYASASTMRPRKLLVFCLLLPWSHPLGNVNKQERAKGSPCISKSVCARESEEKGKVQESAQWIGLGLKKKKKSQVCGKWGRGGCGALSSSETGGCCLRFPLWGREVLLMATFWKVCFPRLGAAAHENTWAHKQGGALPSLEAWNRAHYLITACLLPLISR